MEAVANIPSQGDGTVANILNEIHKTAVSQYKSSLDEHRKAVAERHNLLKKMMPYWRRMAQTLEQVGKTITGLHERARVIDNRMTEYEEIREQTDKLSLIHI